MKLFLTLILLLSSMFGSLKEEQINKYDVSLTYNTKTKKISYKMEQPPKEEMKENIYLLKTKELLKTLKKPTNLFEIVENLTKMQNVYENSIYSVKITDQKKIFLFKRGKTYTNGLKMSSFLNIGEKYSKDSKYNVFFNSEWRKEIMCSSLFLYFNLTKGELEYTQIYKDIENKEIFIDKYTQKSCIKVYNSIINKK